MPPRKCYRNNASVKKYAMIRLKGFIPLLLLILLLAAGLYLPSCSQSTTPRVCTAQFVVHQVTVLDTGGEPADSVDIGITDRDTGEAFNPCESEAFDCAAEGYEGNYTLIHDGYFEESEEGREFRLRVTGQKNQTNFEADYTFRNDGCHIQKVAGPDSVQLEASNQKHRLTVLAPARDRHPHVTTAGNPKP